MSTLYAAATSLTVSPAPSLESASRCWCAVMANGLPNFTPAAFARALPSPVRDLMSDLSKNMLGRTFCPLGDAAALPTISIVAKWRNEFEEHLNGRCPYKSAEALVGSR